MKLFPVVILCGGLATRVKPLTTNLPKALIDINGEPFIAFQLRYLKQQGVTNVLLCTGYLGEQIKAYVGDGSTFGLTVNYSDEGDKQLGTAGALAKAYPLLADQFFMLYGDVYLQCNLAQIQQSYLEQKKPALMTVFNNSNKHELSNVKYDGSRIITYDKTHSESAMQHIDAGLGVFAKSLFKDIADKHLSELNQTLLNENQLAAYEIQTWYYEVGSFSGIEKFKQFMKDRDGFH